MADPNSRRKQGLCRGGGQKAIDIDEVDIACTAADDELLAVHEALDKLALQDKLKGDLVKLRYFVGMSFEPEGA